jgi:hypothetical protein
MATKVVDPIDLSRYFRNITKLFFYFLFFMNKYYISEIFLNLWAHKQNY